MYNFFSTGLQETVATKNSVKDSSIRRKESGLAAIK